MPPQSGWIELTRIAGLIETGEMPTRSQAAEQR
jgi:hypothetical protein